MGVGRELSLRVGRGGEGLWCPVLEGEVWCGLQAGEAASIRHGNCE